MNDAGSAPSQAVSDSRLRWGRIIGFAVLAEVATILLIVIVIFVHEAFFTKGQSQSVIDDFAKRAPAIIGPVAGVLFTLLAAIRATGPVPDRIRLHGTLLGVAGAILTLPGLITNESVSLRPIYLAAIFAKIGAGFLGGLFSESRRAEAD